MSAQAKVAKVGRRTPKSGKAASVHTPARRIAWRFFIKELARSLMFALSMMALAFIALLCLFMGTGGLQ